MSSLLELKLSIQNEAEPFLIPYSIQGVIVSILGTLLTVPVLWTILRSNLKKLHPDLIMSCILCLINLSASISLFFTCIFILSGNNLLVYNDSLCDLQLLTLVIPLMCNSYLIGLISVERCLLIVFNIQPNKVTYLALSSILVIFPQIMCIWVLCNNHAMLSISGVYCKHYAKISIGAYVLFIYMLLGTSSLICVIFSYSSIVIFRHKQLNRNRLSLHLTKSEVLKDKLIIIFKSLLILVIFFVNHFGKIFILIREGIFKLPRTFLIDSISQNLMTYSCISDVSMMLLMNREIREKFLKLILPKRYA